MIAASFVEQDFRDKEMRVSVQVVTHELPIIGAQVDATRAGVEAVLSAAQPIAQPGLHSMSPLADIVSQFVTGARALYSDLYFTRTTNPGVAKMTHRRDALVQCAADYEAMDASGGRSVGTAAAFAV